MSTKTPISVGVVGVGNWAKYGHIPVLKLLQEYKLSAIYARGAMSPSPLLRNMACPYKGDASYYSIPTGGDRSLDAVWTYETPFEAMAQIKDCVAFYPDRVDEIS